MQNEAKYYNAFNLTGEIGPVRFKKLLARFKSLEKAWGASGNEISQTGLGENITARIIEKRKKISPEAEWEKLLKEKISVITILDKSYPKLLKEIYSPPAIIYIKGKLDDPLESPIAVVGSRKISSYGRQAAKDLVGGLARSGATIVSGMSYGADTAAHEAAIENGAKTIAVLGLGLDEKNLYSKKRLAEKIAENGALISEYPYGMPAYKFHFPMRNRIIAGLSLGVLIIEAAKKSGSLITARYAMEENREVFAVPGSIYSPNSEGTNDLIKSGAKAVTGYSEILEDMDLTKIENCINNRKVTAAMPEEETILSALTAEPLHIDGIAEKANIASSRIASILMLMEMKGMVKSLGGGIYTIMK